MQTTEFLVEALKTEGITHLFTVTGGLLDPFLPTLSSTSGVTPVVAAHEGGATYMADGYARADGSGRASSLVGPASPTRSPPLPPPGPTAPQSPYSQGRSPRTGREGAVLRTPARLRWTTLPFSVRLPSLPWRWRTSTFSITTSGLR